MTELMRRIIFTVSLVLIATTISSRAQSKEFIPVDVEDIRKNPQVFWAKGIVFRAVLDEIPKNRLLRIDGRDVVQFKTKQLGDVYAEVSVADQIKGLELGKEYLFSGVIGQTERKFFGGGGDYFAIIQKVAEPIADGSTVRSSIADLNLKDTTNIYNMVFITLDQIMRAAEKDMFASVNSQGLTVQQVFDPAKPQLDKVKTSVRKILREVEENSKLPLEEYFVTLIIAIMAHQQGYTEPVPAVFLPDAMTEEVVPATAGQDTEIVDPLLTKDAWDLSEKGGEVTPVPAVEPDATNVVTNEVVPDEIIVDQTVPEMMESEALEPAADDMDVLANEDANSAISPQSDEMIETAVEEPSSAAVTTTADAPEPAINPEAVDAMPTETEEAVGAVVLEMNDDDFWGVTPDSDGVIDQAPAEVESASPVDAPVEIEIDEESNTIESTPEVIAPEPITMVAPEAPVVEESVAAEVVLEPVATVTNPAPEKVTAKKPAKKKKTEKKKPVEEKVEEPKPVVEEPANPDPISRQDEIDYSKPMRVR